MNTKSGFTLIELSIVLVIIGLIVGGVLVGRDLIRAAEVRATISQIEKYNTAVNTFFGKYGYLPGDIKDPEATRFGLAARGAYAGEGDGNGILEGVYCDNVACNAGVSQGVGETGLFWVDLSSKAGGNLIEGSFNTAAAANFFGTAAGTQIPLYLPAAKIGTGNYFYVYSSDYYVGSWSTASLGVNYFGLSAINVITANSGNSTMSSTANLPVALAFAIDKKMDDGFPQSGRVMAWYLNTYQYWTDGTDATVTPNEPTPYTGALPASSATCYDNGGVAGATTQYSLSQNNGAGPNCALSFKFQ